MGLGEEPTKNCSHIWDGRSRNDSWQLRKSPSGNFNVETGGVGTLFCIVCAFLIAVDITYVRVLCFYCVSLVDCVILVYLCVYIVRLKLLLTINVILYLDCNTMQCHVVNWTRVLDCINYGRPTRFRFQRLLWQMWHFSAENIVFILGQKLWHFESRLETWVGTNLIHGKKCAISR